MTSATPSPREVLPANVKHAFPARALRVRLGPDAEAHPWSGYLPRQLLPDREAVVAAGGTGGDLPRLDGDHALGSPDGSQAGGHRGGRPMDAGSGHEPGASPTPAAASSIGPGISVEGRVWALSRDAIGSREVQRALETAPNDQARACLARELEGKVIEAMWCPHANHVVQKCIESLRPTALQFVVDELTQRAGAVARAARHKYGCRIVQRLVEHCLPAQVSDLVEMLLEDVVMMSRHPYGNYVMQSLLEHGTEGQKRRLLLELERNAQAVGRDNYGCAVMSAAMCQSTFEEQVSLARVLVREPGLLCFMAQARHGHLAVKLVLQALEGSEREVARRLLLAETPSLKASRYGRIVIASLHTPGAGARSSAASATASVAGGA